MKRNELLNAMRPSKRRQAVEMALQPSGVTAGQMVTTLGQPFTNSLRSLHMQGVATLLTARAANGHVAYHLLADESLTAEALRAQQHRREAYARMMQVEPDYADVELCDNLDD